MATKLYDNSGYEVSFEDETPEEERNLYLKIYPIVDKVAERRIHCTSCNSHIGTAPNAEARVRMHPVLKVTHCRNCHSFYNSGEFDKGEDGSELYCRWCGQGGEVYCCSSCPYVFCKKCIVQNFSRSMITEIERQDNWECFNCSPQILFNLRAQHWALMNFIEKQVKEIRAAGLSEDEIEERMAKDSTTCCRRRAEVTLKKVAPPAKKRSASPIKGPPAKKPPEKVFRASTLLGGGTSAPSVAQPLRSQPARAASSLVCAPDILSMFSDDIPDVQQLAPPTPRITISTQPTRQVRAATPSNVPPLAIRQYMPGQNPNRAQIRPAYVQQQGNNVPMVQITQGSRPVSYQRQPQSTPGGPVYHTINGFRIDLNTAAQQDTYRLPNGKLIQVKKQAPLQQSASGAPRPQMNRANVGGTQFTLRYPSQPQTQPRVINGAVPPVQIQQGYQRPQLQPIPQVRPVATGLPLTAPPVTLQKPCHPPTPLGIARNAFEFKVYNTLEVCHQIIGKINTLSNYPSYKNVNHVSELKDLYTHLSYLITYAITRFTTVKDKCAEESKALGLDEEKEKSKDKADDELEVIEKETPVIEIDSEDENEASNQTNSPPKETPIMIVRPSTSSSEPVLISPQSSIESIIAELGDPKLTLTPRVEILRAETLIPSVKQLLKKERKDSNASGDIEMIEISEREAEAQNDSDDEPISNLFEVTPDISVMMGNDEEEREVESDKDSVVELTDSPLMTIVTMEEEKDEVATATESANETEKTDNTESTYEQAEKMDDSDDVVIIPTQDPLTVSSESNKDTEMVETEKNVAENEKNDVESQEKEEGEIEIQNPEEVISLDDTSEIADAEQTEHNDKTQEQSNNDTESQIQNAPNPENSISEENDNPVPSADDNQPSSPKTHIEERQLTLENVELFPGKDDDNQPSSPKTQEDGEIVSDSLDDLTKEKENPNPEEHPPKSPKLQENEDFEMTEAPETNREHVDTNDGQSNDVPLENHIEERQLTLEDVELFPEDENPDKELGGLNKGEDLSIEDFNLGESELSDLAENLVQQGWDI